MINATTTEVFIVMKDGPDKFYLMKVVQRGFDVYCIPPHLGMHYSLHESGKAHHSSEGQAQKSGREPPVILMDGEAGTPIANGIMRASLSGLGSACGICTAIYPVDSLGSDFRRLGPESSRMFVVDKGLMPKGYGWVEIGVWAVPDKNQVSFYDNVREFRRIICTRWLRSSPRFGSMLCLLLVNEHRA